MRLKIADKKRFILITSSLLVLILVVWVVSSTAPSSVPEGGRNSQLSPLERKVPVNPFAKLKSPVALSYLGDEKIFPSEAASYSLEGTDLSVEEIRSLAAKFGFTDNPTVSEDKVQGKVYFWSGNEATLRWREKQQVVKFALKNLKVAKGTVPLSFDEGKRLAQAFLEKYNLWSGLTFTEDYQYLKNLETAAVPSEVRLSEGVKVTLTYTVGNLFLWDEFLGGEPVSLTLLNDGRVAFVSYLFFRQSQLKNTGAVPLKTLSEIRQDLDRGQGLAVSSLSKNPERAPAVPTDGLLNQVQLILLHSLGTRTVQPFFIFSGPSVQVLLPASQGN